MPVQSRITWALATLVAGVMLGVAGPASADWRRAETANFIIYSDGGERELRDYAIKLETYDYILRLREGRTEQETFRKLPIYVVRGRTQFEQAGGPENAAGVYYITEEDIFAVAIRGDGDETLLHEYFHHVSFQSGRLTAAPGWLIEGLAEYYMTADVRPGEVAIGGYSENRIAILANLSWLSWEDLLTKRGSEFRRGEAVAAYYAQSWLATHWFLSDPQRLAQLNAYLADLAQGAEPLEAFEARVGMTPAQFGRTMRSYLNGRRILTTRFSFPPRAIDVQITRLPDSADELLLLGRRLTVGTPTEERPAVAARVRRAAARFPDDPFAMLQLGHAELHFGDAEAGEAVLTRLLEIEPDNLEALQFMATRRLAQAEEALDDRTRRLSQARGFLARAYAVDEYDYRTLNLIAETRNGADGYPNDNDVTVLEQAFTLAPQMSGTRVQLAQVYMARERFDDATALLRPVANAPHGGSLAEYAQRLLADAEAGRPPSAPPETPDEDEDEPL